MPPGLTNIVIPAASQNDTAYLAAPVGMNLKIGGRTYSQFIVSTNGWLALCNGGPIPPALVAGGYLNTNSLATYPGGLPIFAPYWDDLATIIIGYVYTGGALWVRWTAKLDKNAPAAANCFWVKIDGTTGVVNYIYANLGAYVLSTPPPSASIGLAGICTGDYYSYNGAGLDSTIETSNISTKPNWAIFAFTPYQWGDNCVNAKDLDTLGATCTPSTGIINNATSSGSANCSTLDVADVWYKIVKPAGIANVLITTSPSALCQPIIGTSIEVFSSCGGPSLGCATTSILNPGFGELNVARPNVVEDLFIRVTSDNDIGGKFSICIKGDTTSTSLNELFIDDESSVTIFPNPVGTLLTVSMKNKENIRIINFLGKIMELYKTSPFSNEQIQLDISSLPSGIYFLNITENTGQSSAYRA